MLEMLSSLMGGEDVVGLDIGDSYVAAARVATRKNGSLVLRNGGWIEYDKRSSVDDVVSALKRLWRECAMPSYTVCSCLRTGSLAFIHFDYPRVSENDLETTLRSRAEETMQLPPEEILLDWHIIETDGNIQDSVRRIKGILVGVPRREVRRHRAILEKAGLYPIVVDTAPTALSNLFFDLPGSETGQNICLVNLCRNSADIAALFRDGSVYPRTVLSHSAPWDQASDYLVENIRDVIAYCQYKLFLEPVECLYLTGRILSDDLASMLGRKLMLPVEIWNPIKNHRLALTRRTAWMGREGGASSIMSTCLGLAARKSEYVQIPD